MNKGRPKKGEVSIRKYVEDNFPSVKDWLYGIKNGRASEKTRCNYAGGIHYYAEFVHSNPDQLLTERKKEFLSQEQDVRFKAENIFRNFLKSYTGKASVQFAISTAVKSFYKYHRMELSEPGVTNYTQSGEVLDYIPTSEEILKMYLKASERGANTTARDRAYLLLFAETGLRPRTLCSLKFKNIKDEFIHKKTPWAIAVPSASTKMKIHSTSFALEDVRQALITYFEERKEKGEEITNESYLFLSGFDSKNSANPGSMDTIVSELAALAGLPTKFDGTFRFRPYCLRKRFQTIAELRKIPPNWVDNLMNHVPRGADASNYSTPSTEMLRTAFSSMSRDLIILPEFMKTLGDSPTMTVTYEALKQALRFLPLGQRTLEVTTKIKDIDESKVSFQEKYDQLYRLAKTEITLFRAGNDEFEDVVLSTEEAEKQINERGAKFVSNFSQGKIVIKRKKLTHSDENLQHQITQTLQSQSNDGTLGLDDLLQANFNSIN